MALPPKATTAVFISSPCLLLSPPGRYPARGPRRKGVRRKDHHAFFPELLLLGAEPLRVTFSPAHVSDVCDRASLFPGSRLRRPYRRQEVPRRVGARHVAEHDVEEYYVDVGLRGFVYKPFAPERKAYK